MELNIIQVVAPGSERMLAFVAWEEWVGSEPWPAVAIVELVGA